MYDLDKSKIILNSILSLTTSLSTIIGGIWAFHKWEQTKKIEAIETSVALDGCLNIEKNSNSLDENYEVVSILANWNNRSPRIVHINKDKTRIEIYELDENSDKTIISDITAKLIDIFYICIEKREFVFQPKTNSILSHHFNLEKNKTYLIRWKLYKNEQMYNCKEFAWTLEKIFTL